MTEMKRAFTSIDSYNEFMDQQKENERLKTELAEVKRFLQELYHSGKVTELWRVRMQRFVK